MKYVLMKKALYERRFPLFWNGKNWVKFSERKVYDDEVDCLLEAPENIDWKEHKIIEVQG